jgi:hypothetical protein
MFAAPFPTETITARYTEATLRAKVTDPDSTPSQSDILLVSASYLAPATNGGVVETSLVLLDDGGASLFTFAQAGTRPEDCGDDPVAGFCGCQEAHYGLGSHDATAGDDQYTRVLALLKRGPGSPTGVNANAVLANCIARSKGLFPGPATTDAFLQFKIEAVDRSGNLATWPIQPQVTVDPSSLTCDGDACGCCLLVSDNPTADPANGGCSGLAGLAGVPGSGFENGVCRTLF